MANPRDDMAEEHRMNFERVFTQLKQLREVTNEVMEVLGCAPPESESKAQIDEIGVLHLKLTAHLEDVGQRLVEQHRDAVRIREHVRDLRASITSER